MPNSTLIAICSGFGAFLCALLAVFVGMKLQENLKTISHSDIQSVLGTGGGFLFKSLDLDDNGVIDAREFAPLLEQFNNQPFVNLKKANDKEEAGATEFITLKTRFKPLLLNSLRGTGGESTPLYLKNDTISAGLRHWTKPEMKQETFNTLEFAGFLPPFRGTEVGKPWFIYRMEKDMYPSHRYYPPVSEGNGAIIVKMLKMFHPRPFITTRFAPQGSTAVIRARNKDYLDISFRIHAEFQLNEPPAWPFWFTPAQIKGNLIMSKDQRRIEYFQAYVPSAQKLNVDMEWMTGPDENENMQVDIGYMPQMELESVAPSSANALEASIERFHYPSLEWDEEITEAKAANELEKAMYPFKQVDYYKFEEAFARAKASNKLVHSIVMWGALDDQSC